jgi:site-specific DNA-methyltransferase (adenine-specific)
MALLSEGFRILNDVIWEKPCPPPNLGRRCFTHSTELLLWATKAQKGSRERYTFNYDQMCAENGGRQMRTVWRISPPGQEEKTLGRHPTQKPLALVARCLRASTKPDDIVCDPFLGSGTAALAALGLGRRFIGCDSNAEFVSLAKVRILESQIQQSGFRNKDAR